MPTAGKGKALVDLLVEQLGIPKNCKGFDLHFEVGEPIEVTIRTYATDDDQAFDGSVIEAVESRFQLVEVFDGDA
ncbi:hypothetical protein AB4851_08725 [Burkholderia sp. 22PA0099]|uniref:hypothetical protein n=1 Tax=Burkholderia sp. 22PA0099 TaxID=3237372 RepID=UPI0039C37DC3